VWRWWYAAADEATGTGPEAAAGAIPGERGWSLESRVGIYLPASVEMMIGVLGGDEGGRSGRAAGARAPPAAGEYMLEDAGIEWVLVEFGKR